MLLETVDNNYYSRLHCGDVTDMASDCKCLFLFHVVAVFAGWNSISTGFQLHLHISSVTYPVFWISLVYTSSWQMNVERTTLSGARIQCLRIVVQRCTNKARRLVMLVRNQICVHNISDQLKSTSFLCLGEMLMKLNYVLWIASRPSRLDDFLKRTH